MWAYVGESPNYTDRVIEFHTYDNHGNIATPESLAAMQELQGELGD
jgi:hypothetical protein